MLELFNIIFDGKFVTRDCKSYDTPKIGVFKVVFKLKEEELVFTLEIVLEIVKPLMQIFLSGILAVELILWECL